jgi:outer membrane lipoprotein carrier protein
MRVIITFLFSFSMLVAGVLDFETISSEFKQTITSEESSNIVYTGSFYATSKGKALWIYKTPVEKKIYFNQNQVTIVEPELEQVIITNLQNIPSLTEILRGANRTDKNTYEATYDDITYTIHVKNDKIVHISYTDRLENRVTLELFNQTSNAFLDDSLFKIIIPSDFDLIKQ